MKELFPLDSEIIRIALILLGFRPKQKFTEKNGAIIFLKKMFKTRNPSMRKIRHHLTSQYLTIGSRLGYASSNSYASFVLSKLPACFISRWTHSWRMNQLFYNIFNPMENFFLEGFVWWRYERAQWEYAARSRNWIWLDKVTSYVIKQIEWWKIHLVSLVCNNLILCSKEHRFSLYGHTI